MSSALRGVVTKLAQPVKTQLWQKATYTSGPPVIRVSFAEKLTLGGIMVTSVVAPGVYMMTEWKDFPGREIH